MQNRARSGASFPDTAHCQPARIRGGGENRCAAMEETALIIKTYVKQFRPPKQAFLASSADKACHRESLAVFL
jgi:hypothetical protein